MGSREQRRPAPVGGDPLRAARTLRANGFPDEASRACREAVRAAPHDLRTLLSAADFLAAGYDVERAEGLVARAVRLAPRQPDLLAAAGDAMRRFGRPELAEAYYRRALVVAANPATLTALAQLCERRHVLEDARTFVDRALKKEPRLATALLVRARLDRRAGDSESAERSLRGLLSDGALPANVRAEAAGELCTALDAAGDYAGAWEAVTIGKALLAPLAHHAWEAGHFVAMRWQELAKELTADMLARWENQPLRDEPRQVALLTGFPRSGTTLLEQLLGAHPDVVCSEEQDVFGAGVLPLLEGGMPAERPALEMLEAAGVDRLGRARQFYLAAMESLLGEPIGARVHIDKNPATTLMIPAMRRVFPESQIILALRDPRDVATSAFLRYLPINPNSACYLTLDRLVERYLADMEAWFKLREVMGAWVEVRYEDTIGDTAGSVRRVLTALELSWNDALADGRSPRGPKPVMSPSYEQVARPVYATSIGRWRHYEPWMASAYEQLARVTEALGYAS